LAEQTLEAKVHSEAERLLRAALADTSLPKASRTEFRRLLITLLDGQKDQQKLMELEIRSALGEAAPAAAADLRLRLCSSVRSVLLSRAI